MKAPFKVQEHAEMIAIYPMIHSCPRQRKEENARGGTREDTE